MDKESSMPALTKTESCLDPIRTVLVLDDLSGSWSSICRMLRQNGYTVIFGSEDEAAEEILETVNASRRNADVLFVPGDLAAEVRA